MYCKQCGAELRDGAKFCGVCGTPAVSAPSAADEAICIEAQPHIEDDNAALIANLQESMHEGIISLARAAAFSVAYVLIAYALFMKNSMTLSNVLPMALILIGPWKLIISLYKKGVRLPSLYGWGPVFLVMIVLKLLVIILLPMLVLMGFMGLGDLLHGVIPFLSGYMLMGLVAFWPLISAANIIYKAIRIHMLKA